MINLGGIFLLEVFMPFPSVEVCLSFRETFFYLENFSFSFSYFERYRYLKFFSFSLAANTLLFVSKSSL